jgi:hypothetical protein
MDTTTLVQTRNVSQSVAYRVVGMTWDINAAWYLLHCCRLALLGNISLGHVTNCKYIIRYCNGWCNFDIDSVMWIHDTFPGIVNCMHNGYSGWLIWGPHRVGIRAILTLGDPSLAWALVRKLLFE